MNKKVTKIIAICLCAALCLGGAGVAFAQTGSEQESAQPTAAQKAADLQQKISKDETVYVLAGADGSVQKIIVSDWLTYPDKLETLTASDYWPFPVYADLLFSV